MDFDIIHFVREKRVFENKNSSINESYSLLIEINWKKLCIGDLTIQNFNEYSGIESDICKQNIYLF